MAQSEGAQPLVRIDGLRKSYDEHTVLDGITLDVNAGDVVALIGPSGAGKSTLLRCINYLEIPDEGVIELEGRPTAVTPSAPTKAELLAVRRKTGMVFQGFHLFPHLSVLRNITLAQELVLGRSSEESEHRALQLLERVGLKEKAGARPTQCSGGQQQRIAIARALALEPVVMLFDEPTSALDPEVSVDVLRVMRELADLGTTMIVVTHEMGFARRVADRVAMLAGGSLVEQGEPATMFDDPQHEVTARFLNAVFDR
ncbi:amino acid ABC transporter ATP-binding protein [Aeromicrobium sp. YIM 150415]|uniref:amino acid ABC transporter ATP-binding protein n=1 Tax=Aeromicrobium sp. YIM 150415 TaxID=2803912 RepID=UPI0023DD55A6|nr:amino acid ABC transporter ATP-binding protein [Aeromicrobium sp. YIM 150415]